MVTARGISVVPTKPLPPVRKRVFLGSWAVILAGGTWVGWELVSCGLVDGMGWDGMSEMLFMIGIGERMWYLYMFCVDVNGGLHWT